MDEKFNKLKEDIVMRVKLELPTMTTALLAVTHNGEFYEIWYYDLPQWVKQWTNLHDWKTITDRLGRTIEGLAS